MESNQFLSFNNARLRGLKKILKQVNKKSKYMESLSDEELQYQTVIFKERLSKGETLDDILPDAFAAIREADKRVLGMYPHDVQVLGGIAIHQGNIAEMKTGEGKTLTATLPLYLNALTGKGVMLVTINSYLALRDAEEMGEVYKWMGLTISPGFKDSPENKLKPEEKRKIYSSDIVYTTNGVLGFDYLGDNLVDDASKKYMREFNFAIIDEVDAVLLDSAQTPLVISGIPKVQSNLYKITSDFVKTLREDEDYVCDEERKNIWLTRKGIEEAQRFFNIENMYEKKYFNLVRNIMLALRAEYILEKDRDYVVLDNKITLLDSKTGRLLPGTKLQSGQHQALEAKENLKISLESKTMATITYQNLFRMFKKLGGMSGTAKVAEEEFISTYAMAVIAIPTHKPIIRKDLPDSFYSTLPEKLYASMEYIKEIHSKGQPLLIVTGSVDLSEIYSELLLREGISHNVLNAYNTAKEAMIIKEAGQFGAVTVATAMAGRGTDIKLGDDVEELGGLVVVGTERMESKRIDLQLRGRAGRQGDPGISKFFVSLEDDVVVKWGPNWIKKYHQKQGTPGFKKLSKYKLKKTINNSQVFSDSTGKNNRDMSLHFDESVKIQRNIVYKERNKLLLGLGEEYDIEQLSKDSIDIFFKNKPEATPLEIKRYIFDNIDYNFGEFDKLSSLKNIVDKKEFLLNLIEKEQEKKYLFLKNEDEYLKFKRLAFLKAIDEAWIDQIDNLQLLKSIVIGRQFAQKNPIFEYYKEALLSYKLMQDEVKVQLIRNLSLSQIKKEDDKITIYFS